jgi:Domain of unknown function (DUF4169)
MAEIINLRSVRKEKARAEKQVVAAKNRLKFGQTKAQNDMQKASDRLAVALLDGHKRDAEP